MGLRISFLLGRVAPKYQYGIRAEVAVFWEERCISRDLTDTV